MIILLDVPGSICYTQLEGNLCLCEHEPILPLFQKSHETPESAGENF